MAEERTPTYYVDLPAIIAGTILALAISVILAHFGSSVGLAYTTEAEWDQDTAIGKLVAMGLWLLWVQVLASLAGGYVAGRMRQSVPGAREHEREMRDGIHGILVWAAGTVAVVVGVAMASALAAAVTTDPEAAERAEEVLDMQRNAGVIVAFATAAASLVSGVAAWWAATLGGEHRDQGVDHSRYVSFRR
jgi:hypothetical protein